MRVRICLPSAEVVAIIINHLKDRVTKKKFLAMFQFVFGDIYDEIVHC
jgi:hypothetical protein